MASAAAGVISKSLTADKELCNVEDLLQREFIVDVPLEQAWRHLARVEAWPSWAKHIKSVTLERPGELSPSTVGTLHLTNGLKARFAMTEFVPNSHWKWASNFLWLRIYYDHRFEPIEDDRTKMQFIIEARDLGFGKFVLAKLYAAIYHKILDKAIVNLVADPVCEPRVGEPEPVARSGLGSAACYIRSPFALGNQAITWKSSTLFREVIATPSARSRAICLRPTAPSFVELTTPLAATTRNQGSCWDSSFESLARTKATWRAVPRR